MYCKKFRGILRSNNFQHYKLSLVRVRCKMWSCAYCAEKNSRMWRYSIIKQVHDKFPDSQWSFFTITISLPDFDTLKRRERAIKSAKIFRDNANTLMMRLKRQYGKFQYIRVLESHKSGQLHAHFLANFIFTDLEQESRGKGKEVSISASLKEHAIACNFGWVTHAENLQDEGGAWSPVRAVSYVTKYITKDSQMIVAEHKNLGVRKIVTSRGFISPFNPKNKQESDATWYIASPVSKPIADEIGLDNIFDVNRKKTLEEIDFTGDYYPPKES